MHRGDWKMHTHWRWRPADPIRHIYLFQHRSTGVWKVTASEGRSGEGWEREYAQFSDAMAICQAMVDRTGGDEAWHRTGPGETGNQFS